MKPHLVEAALAVIPSQQILVNMVSRRVRQLSFGARPMVEVVPGLGHGHADIALREIADKKLTFEPSGSNDQKEAAPEIVEFPGVIVAKNATKPKGKAA